LAQRFTLITRSMNSDLAESEPRTSKPPRISDRRTARLPPAHAPGRDRGSHRDRS
jgi:hypothetical protein